MIGQDIAEELFAKEECFDIARKNLKESYTKDVLKSAKDSKIYNILGRSFSASGIVSSDTEHNPTTAAPMAFGISLGR